jgi:hypothetical protein
VPLRVVRHRKAATEFFQLPPTARAVYERAIRRMAAESFASGPGYEIAQLSPPAGIVSPIWCMKVGGFRMFYVVDGDAVKIGGFGARPGFYRKLSRVKELLRDRQ